MSAKTLLSGAALATLLPAGPAFAKEDLHAMILELSKQVAELKQQSAQSEARIHELEKNLEREKEEKRQLAAVRPPSAAMAAEVASQAKPPVTLGDVKGTFKVPGTETSLGFGGFVKLDVYENSVSAGANKMGDLILYAPQIPLSRHGENSQMAFNARESRLWFKSFTPSRWGDIGTYLELDLYGSADSYTPRLRHAYGTFGNLLAGQTWTTFLNEYALPDTLDNSGPFGTPKLRQPMVRWTQPFTAAGQSMEFQVAAESPGNALWTGGWDPTKPDTLSSPGSERYPDMVARLNYKPEWGYFSLAAMGRQIRYSGTTVARASETWGGAVGLSGKINLFDTDNFRFMLNYGNALGRYMALDRQEDAAVDVAGNLHQNNIYSAMAAYQHWWNKEWRSTVAYGFQHADHAGFVNKAMTDEEQSVHANLLWSPVSQATLGVEYIHGTRKVIDGRSGALDRVQFSAKYNF